MLKSFENTVCFFPMQTVVMKSKYITKIGFNLSIFKEIATKNYKINAVQFFSLSVLELYSMLTLESMFRLSQYPLKRPTCRHHVFPVYLSCFRLHFFFIFTSHDSGIELVNYALINGMTKCILLYVPQMVGRRININQLSARYSLVKRSF